jgi:hypothetical protein
VYAFDAGAFGSSEVLASTKYLKIE